MHSMQCIVDELFPEGSLNIFSKYVLVNSFAIIVFIRKVNSTKQYVQTKVQRGRQVFSPSLLVKLEEKQILFYKQTKCRRDG